VHEDSIHESVSCLLFNVLASSQRSYYPAYGQHGQGVGQVMVEYLDCTGDEWSITQCASAPWNTGTCSHYYDIYVDCGGG